MVFSCINEHPMKSYWTSSEEVPREKEVLVQVQHLLPTCFLAIFKEFRPQLSSWSPRQPRTSLRRKRRCPRSPRPSLKGVLFVKGSRVAYKYPFNASCKKKIDDDQWISLLQELSFAFALCIDPPWGSGCETLAFAFEHRASVRECIYLFSSSSTSINHTDPSSATSLFLQILWILVTDSSLPTLRRIFYIERGFRNIFQISKTLKIHQLMAWSVKPCRFIISASHLYLFSFSKLIGLC